MNIEVTEITVGASTGFNHPYELYANFRPSVTLKAKLEGGATQILEEATRQLQLAAQKLVNDEKARILGELRREREIESESEKLVRLQIRLKGHDEAVVCYPIEAQELRAELAVDDAKPTEQKMPGWNRASNVERLENITKFLAEADTARANIVSSIELTEKRIALLRSGVDAPAVAIAAEHQL